MHFWSPGFQKMSSWGTQMEVREHPPISSEPLYGLGLRFRVRESTHTYYRHGFHSLGVRNILQIDPTTLPKIVKDALKDASTSGVGLVVLPSQSLLCLGSFNLPVICGQAPSKLLKYYEAEGYWLQDLPRK